MSESSPFYGPNAGYVLELYERYRQNSGSVDAETRAFFEHWQPSPAQANGTAVAAQTAPLAAAAPSSSPWSETEVARTAAAARLARFIRQRGHLGADVDPLHLEKPLDAGLELGDHKLTAEDLRSLPASVVGGPIAEMTRNAQEAIEKLREVYSGTIGYDDEHIQNSEERYWLRNAAESQQFVFGIDAARKRQVLERLTEVESFERFLHKTFVNAKRFSIEGTDMLVPVLDEIIHNSAESGTKEVVLGMAHRGRLNVLTHILGKPYAKILSEFESAKHEEGTSVAGRASQGWTGDVKYHLGHRRSYKGNGSPEITLTLVPNPSHLEFVNPVVEGHARAGQDQRSERGEPSQEPKLSLAVLIHGDAAFPGQGIVAETLNMCRLKGYGTGGTIHIIVNNQIGFMTTPEEDRSTRYASDLAKGFEIPVVHVNADDPAACLAAARMALAYREKFHKDFLIDLIGYRRYGHNENEDPTYTQPEMYEVIPDHPRVREIWAKRLESEGIIAAEDAEIMLNADYAELQDELKIARSAGPKPASASSNVEASGRNPWTQIPETAVPAERLKELNIAILTWPPDFTPNPKLDRVVFNRRRDALNGEHSILWGHAEALAFASILSDGTPIRLTGQDCQPGTFGHRHAVLHDPHTGQTYTPLQNLPAARAAFAIYNSPLSENAALGFEYGYSMHAPGVLVIWEAQFGDFANGAQVIIDQFLVSGNAKWRQIPSLVLLLPHGYEGQGPEHSSARLERFLQLAANENIRVVNCTTPAQYFHLLRRQAALLETDPRPLVVMSPKSLLKDAAVASSLSDLAEGKFQPVIPDMRALRADQITRLILCSGKVYVDLIKDPAFSHSEQVAAARVEELYPFPGDEIHALIRSYPNLRELVWMQEEPANMGAWTFVGPKLQDLFSNLRYVGRAEAASPAEGSMMRHTAEQARILSDALCNPPELPVRRQKATLQAAK